MTDSMFLQSLIPTDVSIYYENSMPYLDYTGVTRTADGCEVKVHIPKISLVYKVIENKSETIDQNVCDRHGAIINKLSVKLNQEVLIKNDEWFDAQIIKRQMTKKQIEKELGYKVAIVED